ncbi:hypothetical protein CYLTODRAFT_284211 [Cylindrobasidium torrendii FP15055 ss-10]|uniref:DUF6593 domain-containing protein n=1 Tax=Cylindrobasidium torrendii FP15055 ss-10 TaxID=1314674 RepID=A0A0D7BTH3_9AGAR|nr:hypothetical protein CYLTODRAFT_284211 [Cylindrobasidium torrendii FP15055 ss-10]
MASSDDVLSWTNQDPRESKLFNNYGVLYTFKTVVAANGQSTTTLYRTIRANKEDRVAKFEWAANGGLGRLIMGKTTLTMADVVAPGSVYGSRQFNGPDGQRYMWRPAGTNSDLLLQDSTGVVIAFFRPTHPTRYQMGDVYGELHFLRTAGSGTVMHPPIMDMVTVTAMLFRFCALFNL